LSSNSQSSSGTSDGHGIFAGMRRHRRATYYQSIIDAVVKNPDQNVYDAGELKTAKDFLRMYYEVDEEEVEEEEHTIFP
jgi:hypothetical protein